MKYRVRTNSLGFKDREIRDIPMVSDGHRILFMGDSFAEGVGYDWEHTFVGIIDSALALKGIEVLNAAASGYSPIIYWRKTAYLIEDVGLKFDEMIVFPDVSDAIDETRRFLDDSGRVSEFSSKKTAAKGDNISFSNDVEEIDHHILSQEFSKKLKEWFRYNTIFSFAALKLGHRWFNIIRGEKGYTINRAATYWTVDSQKYPEIVEIGLPRISSYMDRLSELLLDHNIKLSVVVFPNPDQVYYADSNSVWVSFWQDWCQQHQVEFINCFSSLIRGQTKEDRERILDTYYIKGDFHFNENGHRLIADEFLRHYTGD